MSGRLDRAAVFLTGGSRGIGLAIAEYAVLSRPAAKGSDPSPSDRGQSLRRKCGDVAVPA